MSRPLPTGTPDDASTTSTSTRDGTDERTVDLPTGVQICYQTFGDAADEVMLLVMGLGGPMTWWDTDLCRLLADAGFFVVRYDNRDAGRSSKLPGRVSRRALVNGFVGRGGPPPYTLDDLAKDGLALLDHLGAASAHVVGVSMGGMIAQTMAVLHPDRVRSLTSISSTTGRRSVGWQDPRLLPLLLARSEATRDAYVATSTRMWRVIGSPGYPETVEDVRVRAGDTFDRGVSPSGVGRQMLAIVRQPDRSHRLSGLRMPTLVIHGLDDKLVHVSGGRATAAAIPGSELVLVPGMGHDLPVQLHRMFVDAITRVARRS